MSDLLNHFNEIYWPTLQILWPCALVSTALAISASCVGTFIILRREALLALALPQVVMLGAAIGLRYGYSPLYCALFTAAAALGLSAIARWRGLSESMLPALYIAGLSFSILMVSGAGAHLAELQNMFTGVDVAVDDTESIWISIVLVITALLCAMLWRRWLLVAQAPAVAELNHLHPVRWNALFMIILGIVVILGTRTLGSTLPTALIFLPAATALSFARRIPSAMLISLILSLFMVIAGFIISVENNYPLSHSIAAVGVVLYLLSFFKRQG